MVILNEQGDVITDPDLDKGKLTSKSVEVKHKYVVDKERKVHYEVIKEYPETGGQDVEEIVDQEEEGHWDTVDTDGQPVPHFDGFIAEDWPHEQEIADVWEYNLYTLYTQEELDEIERQKEEAERARLEYEKQLAFFHQMQSAATMYVRANARVLSDVDALSVSMMFEEWDGDSHIYVMDDKVQYEDLLYKCISNHTSQSTWTPDSAHSLWVRIRPEGEILEWEQPLPGVNEPYNTGDKVKFDGKVWESTMDNNYYKPGEYGWKEVV